MKNMIEMQLKALFKNKIMIINFVVYPSLLTFIIGYLAESYFNSGITSYEYYSNSMMIFLFMGAGLLGIYNLGDTDVVDGNLRAMYMPIPKSYIYISQVISSTIFAAVSIVLNILIFKYLFNIHYAGNELIIILSFITLAFLSNALGMFVLSLVKEIGICNGIFNLIQAILCILGGAFISLEGFGGILSLLTKLSPVKYLIEGILNSIYDNSTQMLWIIIMINIILALVFLGITKRTFKIEKYL
ncbi:MAG: ABC transporter permease [Clostridium sp.]